MAGVREDSIIGIDCLVYGTPDMGLSRKIFENWGLILRQETDQRQDFVCGNGGEIIVHHESVLGLPPKFNDGSNFREVLWGVSSAAALRSIGTELARDREVREDQDGTLHSVDDSGVHIGFRVTRCVDRKPDEEPIYNTVGNYRRIDRRATIYERALPWRMGHLGFRVDDTLALERFYIERLGFWLSDRYAEGGASFLRCSRVNDHHNLFLSASPTGETMFHHVAFEVRDIHEVFGGGLAFSKQGWDTQAGPGRHPVSSAYFWYFKNPLGGAIEYFSDTDICSEAWEPVDFSEPKFSEWHLVDGIKAPAGPAMRSSIDNARERKRQATERGSKA